MVFLSEISTIEANLRCYLLISYLLNFTYLRVDIVEWDLKILFTFFSHKFLKLIQCYN